MRGTLGLSLDDSLPTMEIRRQILKYPPDYHGDHLQNLVVFGPNYKKKDCPFWKNAKNEALEHVLENSKCPSSRLMNTMGSIQDEARAAYAGDALDNLSGCEFLEMMALDGCFFLLLAFSILGAGALLKFSKYHLIFGIGCVDEEMTKWLNSMFFVGNQIPFVVLKKLMELRLFQELLTTNIWEQPSELEKKALHKFLIVRQERDPLDLIHCLQLIVLGTKSAPIAAALEADDVAEGFPSASSLAELGITFGILEEEAGSRGINYKSSAFTAVLNLPVLRVDRYTELMFVCLKKYDIVQQEATGIEREASSFLKFLAELIRGPQDVAVLSSQWVLEGRPESLFAFLRSFDEHVASGHLGRVKTQIRENPPAPWLLLRKLMSKPSTVVYSLLLLVAICMCFIPSLTTT